MRMCGGYLALNSNWNTKEKFKIAKQGKKNNNMKQTNLFGQEFAPNKDEQKYSSKIEAPIYQPKNKQPHFLELYDTKKYHRLINEIRVSKISEDEKRFLSLAATRHIVFNYEIIADYYAHATPETQHLMERSGLVIIDFEKAVEYGYVKLCEDIKNQFLTEYGE